MNNEWRRLTRQEREVSSSFIVPCSSFLVVGVLAVRRAMSSGRVDQGGKPPWPPSDPDVRNSRIRLFATQLRYKTRTGRIVGAGKGKSASSRWKPAHERRPCWERRESHFRHVPLTRWPNRLSILEFPVMP